MSKNSKLCRNTNLSEAKGAFQLGIPPSMLDSTISKPIVPSSYGTADVVVLRVSLNYGLGQSILDY
ncbi:hypothetical protein DAPPUDRAFT_236909 [Daphnia pulex]|uniref:Uncharacterized protein n=1 Tax=Daphnia pulex TaxID=6669 RepID=E9G285_DAPPU|nr:hypothetical protein DAPPUDRAFT_236909 [Daphnia pulex]|eukprot:EFX86346.1 hypothetical protein DAPPUDRAFT_236909 [Daphnia pulex]